MFKSILVSLPRNAKKAIFVLHDLLLIIAAQQLSFVLCAAPQIHTATSANRFNIIFAIAALATLCFFAYHGLYKAVVRYFGSQILLTCVYGSVFSVVLLLLGGFFFDMNLPRNLPLMYFLLLLVLLIGSRFFIRSLLLGKGPLGESVLIYGAGESGRQLLEAINQVRGYQLHAFIDDNPKLHGSTIHDVSVYSSAELGTLIERFAVKKILLAIPSVSNEQRRRIIKSLDQYHCEVLSIPGMKDLIDGRVHINSLKKVSVGDLLGRDAVAAIPELISANIGDKVVMVTGAGGSIGAELCRQIVANRPKRLVLFELSEFFLYSIDKELRELASNLNFDIEIIPLLGSVQHQRRMHNIMSAFAVQTVYHAAAYKHVPMVEFNIIEGVRNNVFGTYYCALAAISSQVESFVLISTDKAVRPTNTMGASKRMAELILQALAQRDDHNTRFCMVRFGNVLGSSGSVVPVFEQQIASGGPVTLTHPEIIRYFMTIPEAAQLVIQAGAMAKGGDVFVLDMGESIKIMDLARQMIRLSGLEVRDHDNPNGDIEIKITGLRPGEKLFEELLIGDNIVGTAHPRIMAAHESLMPWSELEALLEQIQIACQNGEQQSIRDYLLAAPTGFTPSHAICDLLWRQQQG